MSTPADVAALAIAELAIQNADSAVEARAFPTEPIAPEVKAPDPELVPGKTSGDLKRDAIYARQAANRLRPGDESVEAMREAVGQMQGADEGIPITEDPVATNPQAVEQPQQSKINQPAQPLANASEMVTIRVEGREYTVPRSDVEAAGVQTLQKERAADVRLQRASQAEQQIALERAALDRREQEISRAATQTGVAQPGTDGNLPPGGLPANTGIKQALDALLDSDTETAAKALGQVVADQVEQRLRQSNPQAVTGQPRLTPPTGAEIPAPWTNADIQTANQAIEVAFKDILANPAVRAQYTAEIVAEMQNPINRMGRVPIMTLAANVGSNLRERLAAPSPGSNMQDELATRRTLAARVPSVPSAAGSRSGPTAPAAPARQTGSSIVENMRKARGQSV